MKPKNSQFYVFRYQILPIDRQIQPDMIEKINTVEDLLKRKNEFFVKALKAKGSFEYSHSEFITQKLYEKDNFFLYRIAVNRSISRETKEFTVEELDNWPSVLVAIWNIPDKQIIAVQKRMAAFQKPDTVVKFIVESLTKSMELRQLRLIWEPLFDEKVFWDIVKRYKGQVHAIEFEFVSQTWPTSQKGSPMTLNPSQRR